MSQEKVPLSPKVNQWSYNDDSGSDDETTESEMEEVEMKNVEFGDRNLEVNNVVAPNNGVKTQHGDEIDVDAAAEQEVWEEEKDIEKGIPSDGDGDRVLKSQKSIRMMEQEKASKRRRAAAARARVRNSKLTNSKWRGDRLDVIDRKDWLKEIRRFVVEFYGTWTLTLVACMVAVQYEINPRTTPFLPSFAIGFTLTVLIYSVSPVSGAHFNPIVSWAFLLRGMFPIQRVLVYWIAQFGGAMVAGGMVYAIYGTTGNIGATIPSNVSNAEAFYFESIFTFFFVTTILSVSSRAKSIGPNAAMAIGISLCIAHFAIINTTGTGLNPARSLGPAVYVKGTALHVYWIYVAGPFTGSTIAVVFAYFLSLKSGGREGRLLAMGAGRNSDSESSKSSLVKDILNKTSVNLAPLVRAKPRDPPSPAASTPSAPEPKPTQDIEMGEVKAYGGHH